MNKKLILILALTVTLLPLTVTSQTPPPAGKPSPTEPAMRLDKDGKPMQIFLDRHEKFLKRGKEGPIGLLFIGDSITQGWSGELWKKYYEPLNAVNFGIGGDGTSSVLWRIEHGELDGISPKVVVLLIGVNNGLRPGVADGVKKCVEQIRAKLPQSKVLLLGIFPYGNANFPPAWAKDAQGWRDKIRADIASVNKELATLDDGKSVRFLDLGEKFLDADNNVPKELMPDGLHPGPAGYKVWAEGMQPLLEEMLKD